MYELILTDERNDMALKEELGLKTDFTSPAHEALLGIYYTASIMKKRADGFFGQFGLTDVQFNLMNLLYYESGSTLRPSSGQAGSPPGGKAHSTGSTRSPQASSPRLSSGQAGQEGGLSQAQISDMMLVNRANITSLVDRMEKAELVTRTAHANDRRYNIIKLTSKGKHLYTKVEPHYLEQIKEAMAPLDAAELKRLAGMLEKVRRTLRV
jgi:DNA-binding MarR family transcriptional regulator